MNRKRGIKQNEINGKREKIRKQNRRNQIRKNTTENNIDTDCFFENATSDKKIFVFSPNLHEIRSEIIGAYPGGFEMIGDIFLENTNRQQPWDFKILNIKNHELKTLIWIMMPMLLYWEYLIVKFIN